MTFYTVFHPESSYLPYAQHVSAAAAMDIILSHDGHLYEIRRDADGWWSLWVTSGSVNSFGGPGKFWRADIPRSCAATEPQATDEIAAHVVSANWPGIPKAMADDDYDAMMAQLEIENQDD